MEEDYLLLSLKQKEELFEIIDDLFKFANANYENFLLKIDENFQTQENILAEHSIIYYPHLYWWAVFCAPLGKDNDTIFNQFLHKYVTKFIRKKAILHIVLQWKKVHPSFYLHFHSMGDRVLIVKDLFDNTYKVVSVYNDNYITPVHNQLLTGLILPFGKGSYCTIIDFLHISSSNDNSQETPYKILNSSSISFLTSKRLKRNYPSLLANSMKSVLQNQLK